MEPHRFVTRSVEGTRSATRAQACNLSRGGFVCRDNRNLIRYEEHGARVGCWEGSLDAAQYRIQSAIVTVVVLGLALGAFGFQRIANWGELSSGQGNQRAEFNWSRLSYTTAMGGDGVRRLWRPQV